MLYRVSYLMISYKHGNEPSGTTKGGEFLDWLSDCQLLKKNLKKKEV
jgi:hypothetical protein